MGWGSLAPDGAKADDTVPISAARDFTERRCEQSWKAFEEPVKYIVQGFREVIPSTSGLWKLVDGKWRKLSHLIEGSSEVNVDEMLEAVWWGFPSCSSDEKAVIIEVLHDLQKEGQDLPPVKRQLNKLLRFFTGSFKPPVEGWKKDHLQFSCVGSDSGEKCAPLVGKTCHNELRIPSACCKDPATLKAMIAESVVSEGFGYT